MIICNNCMNFMKGSCKLGNEVKYHMFSDGGFKYYSKSCPMIQVDEEERGISPINDFPYDWSYINEN